MTLYSLLSHLFPKRFGHKVFFAAFIGTHIPLISFTIYVLQSTDDLMRYASDFGLILVATLIGTALTLAAMHALLTPLYRINQAMENYEQRGEIQRLPEQFVDEMGDVMRQVNRLVFHVDSSLSRLSHEATTDPLTGLLNRKGLLDRMRGIEEGALLVLDLNRFKAINDTYGHQVGDEVLIRVAQCIQARVRQGGSGDSGDLIARWGGDEFLVILKHASESTARKKAEDIERAVCESFASNQISPRPTVSIGIQMLSGLQFSAALDRADSAMYASKSKRTLHLVQGGVTA
jgi:diguanylate cyclase (GGDEF)-like protein